MSSRIHPKRRGFTLVELLVVIGIIALLISILLPALKKVKEQANTVKCMANMRQVMQACMMYASEYKNNLPIPPSVNDTMANVNSTNPKPWYHNSLMYYISTKAPGGMGVIRYDAGAFWKFLSPGFASAGVNDPEKDGSRILSQVMSCPTEMEDQHRPVHYSGQYQIAAGMLRNFSYSWNRQLRLKFDAGTLSSFGVTTEQPIVRKLSQIKSPANKILLMEELAPNDGMCYMLNGASINQDDEPTFRHNGKGAYGFADGHVAAMLPKELGFKTVSKNSLMHTDYEQRSTVVRWFLLTK